MNPSSLLRMQEEFATFNLTVTQNIVSTPACIAAGGPYLCGKQTASLPPRRTYLTTYGSTILYHIPLFTTFQMWFWLLDPFRKLVRARSSQIVHNIKSLGTPTKTRLETIFQQNYLARKDQKHHDRGRN